MKNYTYKGIWKGEKGFIMPMTRIYNTIPEVTNIDFIHDVDGIEKVLITFSNREALTAFTLKHGDSYE